MLKGKKNIGVKISRFLRQISDDSKDKYQPNRTDGLHYNDNASIERVFFICGLHRSGTTIIEQYISSLYDVSTLRANVPENEGQHLQTVYPIAKKFGGPGKFAFSPFMRPSLPSAEEAEHFRNQILVDWGNYIVGHSNTLLDKSPPNLTKIAWLRKVFPKSIFLIIVRDPRAVSAATQKWSKTTLEELMLHWNVAYSIAINDLKSDCYILGYEDFCDNPSIAVENSGFENFITKRKTKGEIDKRFANIVNSNEKYISTHACKYYGRGAWEYFGYNV